MNANRAPGHNNTSPSGRFATGFSTAQPIQVSPGKGRRSMGTNASINSSPRHRRDAGTHGINRRIDRVRDPTVIRFIDQTNSKARWYPVQITIKPLLFAAKTKYRHLSISWGDTSLRHHLIDAGQGITIDPQQERKNTPNYRPQCRHSSSGITVF